MKRIYLDHAASTPVSGAVLRAMEPYYTNRFGNPGSLHAFGQEAIAAVDAARATVADILGVGFREIIFTGSATEANNMALRGTLARFRAAYPDAHPRIVISSVEHDSLIETAKCLEREGVETVLLPVDGKGIVDLARAEKEINARTAFVSVMCVNNEIGTKEPVHEIGKIVRAVREKNAKYGRQFPVFHTDAVQAFAYYPCMPHALRADLMTLSAHKVNGPKGVGILFVRGHGDAALPPLTTGGGQEFGARSGTENVPAIAGAATALARADKKRNAEYKRLMGLKRKLAEGIKECMPDAFIHGCDERSFALAAPHILYVSFPGYPAEELLVRFDGEGIAVSTGSACSARAPKDSHVLSALFANAPRGIRFSMGSVTSKDDIREALLRMRRIFAR